MFVTDSDTLKYAYVLLRVNVAAILSVTISIIKVLTLMKSHLRLCNDDGSSGSEYGLSWQNL